MSIEPPDRNDIRARIAWLRARLNETSDPRARLPLLDELSFRLYLINAEEGNQYAVEEYRIAFSVKDKYWMMRSWLRRGDCTYAMSRYSLALRYFGRAWRLLEELPDSSSDKAYICRNIGTIYYTTGRIRESVKLLELSLQLARQSQEPIEIAATLSLFSRVCMKIGLYERAWNFTREALEIHEARGFLSGAGVSISELGNIYAMLGDWKSAFGSYREALKVHRKTDNLYGQAYASKGMASVQVARRRFLAALPLYAEALRLSQDSGHRFLHAEINKDLGHLHTMLENYQDAVLCLEKAEEEFNAIGSATGRGLVLLERGELFVAQKEWEKAIAVLVEAEPVLMEWRAREPEVRLHRLLAQAYEESGCLRQSLDHYKTLLKLERTLVHNTVQREIVAYRFKERIRKIENEKEGYRARTDRLEREVDLRVKEVTALSLRIAQNDELLGQLRRRLVGLKGANGHTADFINEIVREIDSRTGRVDAWNAFERQLQMLDHDFLHRLTERHPSLTPAEMRICSLLRINMSNKEIGALLNISDRTVDTHRTSIRRKLGLGKEESLVGVLSRV